MKKIFCDLCESEILHYETHFHDSKLDKDFCTDCASAYLGDLHKKINLKRIDIELGFEKELINYKNKIIEEIKLEIKNKKGD